MCRGFSVVMQNGYVTSAKAIQPMLVYWNTQNYGCVCLQHAVATVDKAVFFIYQVVTPCMH